MVSDRNVILLAENYGLLAGKAYAHELIKMIPVEKKKKIPVHVQLPSQVTGTAVVKFQTSILASPQATECRKQNHDSW